MRSRVVAIALEEARETIRRPSRLRQLADRRALRELRASLRRRNIAAGDWSPRGDGRFIGRGYGSYETYVTHQAAKLETLDLEGYDTTYHERLRERLRQAGEVAPRARVICLAARLGTEVRAFHDLGCFAIGIDLNPGPGNRFVVHGDFHHVQFPDGAADVVFTNSLDHAFDPARLLAEVARLLGPGGLFVAEISRGRAEGYAPREYEAFFWNSVDDAIALIEEHGFEHVRSFDFDQPWPGKHVVFRPVERSRA
jgi:SAM-dependent methyltransferase